MYFLFLFVTATNDIRYWFTLGNTLFGSHWNRQFRSHSSSMLNAKHLAFSKISIHGPTYISSVSEPKI